MGPEVPIPKNPRLKSPPYKKTPGKTLLKMPQKPPFFKKECKDPAWRRLSFLLQGGTHR